MNYYFFLNTESSLQSSLEIFNTPPISRFYKKKLVPLYVYAFFSNGNSWDYSFIDIVQPYKNLIVSKNDLPREFWSQSVFLSLHHEKKFNSKSLNLYYPMDSIPEWRCNLKISSPFTSCSYQSEYPRSISKKSISVVSCSSMIQLKKDFKTTFFLVNLNEDPKIKKFPIEIINKNKKILYEGWFYTNTINSINLEIIKDKLSDKDDVIIFITKNEGGIPLYFSSNQNYEMMSLEHTHPPNSFFLFGNTMKFPKNKKKYWFSE